MKLSELGEDRLVAQLLPGTRDDCAAVPAGRGDSLLVFKTDCVVENVHFKTDARPVFVGWKAMARALSDFAAASAVPQHALVTLVARADVEVKWVRGLYRGLRKAAQQFGVEIVGGETSATDGPIVVSVSLAGCVEKQRYTGRGGGRAGDEVFVTGALGGSLAGKHLKFTPRIAESRWLTEHFAIHAMMDLSDGVAADLPRLAAQSGVGFEIDEQALPRTRGCTTEQALSDGEDFELLFAISPNESAKLQARWQKKFSRLPLTRIGRLVRQSKIQNQKSSGGYVHFG